MPTKYLRNVGETNWNVDASWALNSDGSGDTTFPIEIDDVICNALAGNTILTVNVDSNSKLFDCSAFLGTFTGSNFLDTYGDVIFGAGMTFLFIGNNIYGLLIFGNNNPEPTNILTTNGIELTCNITFNSNHSTRLALLNDNLNIGNKTCQLLNGSLNTNGKNINCGIFQDISAVIVNLITSNSTINCSGFILLSTTVLVSTNSTINCSGNFSGGSLIYHNVNLTSNSTISGNNTFNTLNLNGTAAKAITLTAGSVQTIKTLIAEGSLDKKITIQSSTPGVKATLQIANTAFLKYVDLIDIDVVMTTIGQKCYYDENSSIQNCSGLIYRPQNYVNLDDSLCGDAFAFTVETTIENETFTLPLIDGGTYDFLVNWGDRTNNHITAYNDSNITHTYAVPGTYQVQLIGVCSRFSFNNTGNKAKVRKVLNVADLGFVQLDFYGCSGLTDVVRPFRKLIITDLSNLFRSCALTSIPTGLLDNCPNITVLIFAFQNNQITSIPTGLLDNCPNLINLAVTFYNNQITSIPTGLLDNCPNLTNLSAAFQNNQITSIPTGLLDNCPNLTNLYAAFQNNQITSIPTGLLDNCPNLTNLYAAFAANQITSIPTGLLDNCPNLINLAVTFYNNQITSIPTGLLDNCPNLTNLSAAFAINQITSIPTGLLDNCPNLTNLYAAFAINQITQVLNPDIFLHNSLISDISYCFQGDTGLTGSGWQTIISRCEANVPSIVKTGCFSGCTGLTGYPDLIPTAWGGTG